MISSKSYYGLRALIYLAINAREHHVGLREIASNCAIPLRFLELVFSRLKAGQIVESVRGAGGGYLLAKPSEEITVAGIIGACEGKAVFRVSDSVRSRSAGNDCTSVTFFDIIDKQLAILNRNLESITLADVIQSAGLASDMYWI